MAEIMTSLSDMPWLLRGSDPVGSLAAGAQIGSQIATNRARGVAAGQEQQRINLAERQLAQQAAMDEVQRVTMLQQQQMNADKLTTMMEQRQATVANETAFTELTGKINAAFQAENPEGAETAIWESLAKYPGLRLHSGLPDLMENTKTSLAAKIELQKLRSAKLAEPRLVSKQDPGSGRNITFAETSAGRFEELAGTGDLTTATKTELQKQELTNDEAIRTLGEAIAGIQATPSAIGVRGIVGSGIEKFKGQMSPDKPLETPITDVRQKASIAFSRVAPALRVDSGNMSRYELNKLEQAGDVLDVTEAPQTALRKLRNLQDAVTARQLRVDKIQGKKPTDALLLQIPGEEIASLLQSGLLSKEDALRLYELNRANGR